MAIPKQPGSKFSRRELPRHAVTGRPVAPALMSKEAQW